MSLYPIYKYIKYINLSNTEIETNVLLYNFITTYHVGDTFELINYYTLRTGNAILKDYNNYSKRDNLVNHIFTIPMKYFRTHFVKQNKVQRPKIYIYDPQASHISSSSCSPLCILASGSIVNCCAECLALRRK